MRYRSSCKNGRFARATLAVTVAIIATLFLAPEIAEGSGCTDASFFPPTGSPVKVSSIVNPRLLAVADFNLDGKPDIAVNPTSQTGGSVFLGNGAGGFGPAKPFLGIGQSMLSSDFNLDGKPDLVVLNQPNQGTNNIYVLLGDGTGSFVSAPGSPFVPAIPAARLVVADFNLDGKPDVMTAAYGNLASVSLFLGKGDGTLAPAGSAIPVGQAPRDIATADFNLDGKPDVVTLSGSKTATILLGNGGGGFSAAPGSPFDVLRIPDQVLVNDFNNDGKPDLAIEYSPSAAENVIRIFVGSGDGSFALSSSTTTAPNILGWSTADFNLDGNADLASADRKLEKVTMFLGDGQGKLSATPSSVSVGEEPVFVAPGDFNLDGRPDFATVDSFSNQVSIELNGCTAPANAIQFSLADYSVSEGTPQVTVAVTRTGAGAGPATVSFATGDNTAKSGTDYQSVTGTLKWADGDTAAKTFTIPILNDQLIEGPESVNLLLQNPTGGAVLGSPVSALLTIADDEPPPKISIDDVSSVEGNSGTTNFVFTVSLSAVSAQTITANYTTADNTGLATNDYEPINGVVSFVPGETSKSVTVLVDGDGQVEPDESFAVNLYNLNNASAGKVSGLGTIINDDSNSSAPTLQFSKATYAVAEQLGVMAITVTRNGNNTVAAAVDYAGADGSAAQRTDFTYVAGTLTFAPGETSKTFNVLLNQDSYNEGQESFNLMLRNPAGAALGTQNVAQVTISDDVPESLTNTIDDSQAFVHMHYHDFLNREPDAPGLAFWTSQITACGNDAACIAAKRIDVSASFFLSIEYQETAYLLYLMQKSSYATMPKYPSFMRDLQEVSRGVVVNSAGWQQKLAANQQQFADQWTNRPEFKTAYDSLSNDAYVNALYKNAGIVPPQAEKDKLITALNGASMSRSAVLLEVSDDATFRQQERNASFVLMEYFGYLRRDPDAAPDSDLSGYNFWFNKLNQFGGNYIDAEMIKAFITSFEYRQRFGP